MTGKNKCDNLAKVIDMEKIGRQVFLYDFYGELLTEHQKHVYEDVINNIEVKLSMYLKGVRQINYIFKTNKKNIYSKDELFHTTEELLNNLKNKSIKSC